MAPKIFVVVAELLVVTAGVPPSDKDPNIDPDDVVGVPPKIVGAEVVTGLIGLTTTVLTTGAGELVLFTTL